MSEIMLSVAMTAYNHEKYIRQALESILMQKTNFSYEVIVGEDCSTDSTREIVSEFAQRYPDIIKPIFREKNVGSRVNSYEVKQLCRGKYIAYLEGDDYWTDPLKLQTQVDFLEEHSEYIAAVHKFDVIDSEGNEVKIKPFGNYKDAGEYTLEDFEKSSIPSHLATIVMRNIYRDNIEKYKSFLLKENAIQGDIRLSFFLTAHGKIYRMDKVMSVYRLILSGGDNWTSIERRNPRFFRKWEQITELEKEAKEDWGIDLKLTYQRRGYSSRTLLNVLRCRSRESIEDAVKILKYEKKAIPYFFVYIVQKYVLRMF